MTSNSKNSNIASVFSGLFFLAIAATLLYLTWSLRSDAQGRELNVSLGDLYENKIGYGDYITLMDTGVVISAASDIVDEDGKPFGRAFILNGVPDYVFLVETGEALMDTTESMIIPLQPGTLIAPAFKARVNTESDAAPKGLREFATQNGLSTGKNVYSLQAGLSKADNSVPFYITMAFGILALIFSVSSWVGMTRKR